MVSTRSYQPYTKHPNSSKFGVSLPLQGVGNRGFGGLNLEAQGIKYVAKQNPASVERVHRTNWKRRFDMERSL